jgi:hypothetical protein
MPSGTDRAQPNPTVGWTHGLVQRMNGLAGNVASRWGVYQGRQRGARKILRRMGFAQHEPLRTGGAWRRNRNESPQVTGRASAQNVPARKRSQTNSLASDVAPLTHGRRCD